MLCVFKKFMFVHVVLCQFSLCCYNCPILFGLAFSIWIRVKAAIYYIEVSCNTFYTSKFWLDPQRRVSIVTTSHPIWDSGLVQILLHLFPLKKNNYTFSA